MSKIDNTHTFEPRRTSIGKFRPNIPPKSLMQESSINASLDTSFSTASPQQQLSQFPGKLGKCKHCNVGR